MAFSFGQSGFGQTPKPTGFGTAFGTATNPNPTPGTSTTSAFGGFGSTFGAPTSSTAPAPTPAFGTSFGTSFGAPTTSAQPAFGSSFGAPTASAPTPSLFGSSTPATSGGLFSSTGGGGLFGQSSGGLFGASTATSSATAAPSLFGTNPTASTQPSLFSNTGGGSGLFGGGSSLFGSTSTTTSQNLFGGFGTSTMVTTTTASGLFGSSAVKTPGVGTSESKLQQILASFYTINVYGDERDDILKKWNMLQACWGTGKGYYNSTQPPVEYDQTNPFYRLKAIGYVVIPQPDNSEGLVKLQFNKKESEVVTLKPTLISGITGILGNKPNLTLIIEHIKALSDAESEMTISVSEKGVTGASRKIHATDLSAFLNQPSQKQQLASVGVTYIGPYMMPSRSQLEEYLKAPPPGIDAQMWQAAQIDNPHPQKYLPTPMNGFADLKKRILCEEHETGLHRAFLEKVGNEIDELKKKQAASVAQISEFKQKFSQLQHRVLRILVKQEVTRKVGMALQPEEEVLRSRLEFMHSQLSNPTQFKGQLNELVSSVKLMNTMEVYNNNERYKIDPRIQEDIKQFLKMEQNGISNLISIINTDLKDLQIIQDGLNQFLSK